jgi:hypothetical protein
MENTMSLITSLIAAASEEASSLPIPPIGYAGIAAAVFVSLGVVMWSYRDVSNRQNLKHTPGSTDHHTAGH